MSLIKKSDVQNYRAERRKKSVFPFAPTSQPDATGYSGDQLHAAKVNESPVDTSTVKKPQA
ncbi:hypothetical protein [Acidobacterium sp. S8]|uniref:hypothetical protein n=1 Tax=Acidobacterium sp. S8 TaxID=1641854 RepID=UPI00131C299D|nr:hypothetical protein [Acidobacterium sp. S8]